MTLNINYDNYVTQLFQMGGKDNKDWNVWDASAELARQDYNRMISQRGDLPQHTAPIPNKSLTRRMEDAKRELERGVDADELGRDDPIREEVILDQPIVCEDRFATEWDECLRYAQQTEAVDPEIAGMDTEHTKRILIQVGYSSYLTICLRLSMYSLKALYLI